jgi:hypothetical protein
MNRRRVVCVVVVVLFFAGFIAVRLIRDEDGPSAEIKPGAHKVTIRPGTIGAPEKLNLHRWLSLNQTIEGHDSRTPEAGERIEKMLAAGDLVEVSGPAEILEQAGDCILIDVGGRIVWVYKSIVDE